LAWTSLGDVEGTMMGDIAVSAICVYNEQLFIGGNFDSCGSLQASNLAVWNGSSWFSIGTGLNGRVNSLVVFNSALYIAGSFTNATGNSVNNIAKYNSTTGIQNAIEPLVSLEIFPNPSSDYIQLSWSSEVHTNTAITISDLTGKKVWYQYLGATTAGDQKKIIHINSLERGIYFISLNSDQKRYTAQFEVGNNK
jgi:hypothetical protein